MAPKKKAKITTRSSATGKRNKKTSKYNESSFIEDDIDEQTTTTTSSNVSTSYGRIKYNSFISDKEKSDFGDDKFKNYLFEDKWSSLSMFSKGVIINYVIEDFHKRCFPKNDSRGWNAIYEAAKEEFGLNWTWEQHNKYKLNCETFEPVMENIEFLLFFTPHMTNIKQLYLTCKASTISGAGYGVFNELPLRKGQIIGCLFGLEHVQRNYVYDMANRMITGYDFESMYGKFNAGCRMKTKLYSGSKPHPLFGMHMLNDQAYPKLHLAYKAKNDRKSVAYFNYDLSVRMRQGVRHGTEITLSYTSNDEDD